MEKHQRIINKRNRWVLLHVLQKRSYFPMKYKFNLIKCLALMTILIPINQTNATPLPRQNENNSTKLFSYEILRTPKCNLMNFDRSGKCPTRNLNLMLAYCEFICPAEHEPTCINTRQGSSAYICLPRHLRCEKGIRRVAWIEIDENNTDYLSAREEVCPDGTFQQYESDCFNACTSEHLNTNRIPEQYLIFSVGNNSSPTFVYCNYKKGYFNVENKTFLNYDQESRHYPYFCQHVDQSNPCTENKVILPNGTCVLPCPPGICRDPHDDFVCKEKCGSEDIVTTNASVDRSDPTNEEDSRDEKIEQSMQMLGIMSVIGFCIIMCVCIPVLVKKRSVQDKITVQSIFNGQNTETKIKDSRNGPYGESDDESALGIRLLTQDENVDIYSSTSSQMDIENNSLNELSSCSCISKNDEQYSYMASDTLTERESIHDIQGSNRAFLPLLNSPTGDAGGVSDDDDDKRSSNTTDEIERHIDYDHLNWDAVFMFLAKYLSDWTLFFIALYGNSSYRGKFSINAKLQQVAQDARPKDTESIIVAQFQAWKQVTGKNAKYTAISKSLENRQMNETLGEFEKYMRKPPLLSRESIEQPWTHQISPEFDAASETSSIDMRLMPSRSSEFQSCRSAPNDDAMARNSNKVQYSKITKRVSEISYEVSDERLNEIREDPEGVPTISNNDYNQQTNVKRKQEDSSTQNFAFQCGETKEKTENVRSSPKKKAKLSSSQSKQKIRYVRPTRRKVRQRNARRIKGSKTLSKLSFGLLINSFLQSSTSILKPDMYAIYLQNTISEVVKGSGKSAKDILRLRCTDFRDAISHRTKKETIYSMYSGETLMVFIESTYKELRLYMETARQQVVSRLGDHIDKEREDYLFIDYDGNPIRTQEAEAATSREQVQNETGTDESSSVTGKDTVSDEN